MVLAQARVSESGRACIFSCVCVCAHALDRVIARNLKKKVHVFLIELRTDGPVRAIKRYMVNYTAAHKKMLFVITNSKYS